MTYTRYILIHKNVESKISFLYLIYIIYCIIEKKREKDM